MKALWIMLIVGVFVSLVGCESEKEKRQDKIWRKARVEFCLNDCQQLPKNQRPVCEATCRIE